VRPRAGTPAQPVSAAAPDRLIGTTRATFTRCIVLLYGVSKKGYEIVPDLPETVDLQWLARTLLSLQSDVRSLRDDMTVVAAVLNRIDSNQSALINEFRAVRS
jgi:hypothetical protein